MTQKYKPFKHKISDAEVTFICDDWFTLEEFSQFVVSDDEYLCAMPVDDAGVTIPTIIPIVVKEGRMDQEILDSVNKRMERR